MTCDFSDDGFNHNIPLFEQFLGYRKGQQVGSYEGRSAIWLAEDIVFLPASRIEFWRVRNFGGSLEAAGHPDKLMFLSRNIGCDSADGALDSYDFV